MHDLSMDWPTNVDEALQSLLSSLNGRHLERIRRTPSQELDALYAAYENYVIEMSGVFTQELVQDIGISTDSESLRSGARFLIYLLHRRLNEPEPATASVAS